MGIIFAIISPQLNENTDCYQQKIQNNFDGFNIHFTQNASCLFGVIARQDNIAKDCISYSEMQQITVCADATITNKKELLNALNLPITLSITSAELIQRAYLKWNIHCVDHLEGDFTFIIYDHKNGTCIAARDQMGIRPLYYHYQTQNEQLTLASHIGCILPALNSIKVNKDYLKQALTQPFCWGRPFSLDTLYVDINKLAPAHKLMWQQNQAVKTTKYWYFGEEATTHSSTIKMAINDFQDYLQQSILKYTEPYTKITLEVSGGLDSGAIAAYTHLLRPNHTLLALSHAPPVKPTPSQNNEVRGELRFAQAIARHLNIPLQSLDSSFYTEIQQMTPQLAQWLKGACGNLFALQGYPLYEFSVKLGFPAIFSGFGGDEFVSSKATSRMQELKNSKQSCLYLYEKIRSMKFADYICFIRRKLKFSALPKLLVEESMEEIEKFFNEELCGWIKQNQHRDHLSVITQPMLERCYYEGEYANYLQSRLEIGYLITRYFGINYHFPLLDSSLVNYFHQLPTAYKRRHGKGRYLFHKALVGQLPRTLRKRATKATATANAVGFNTRHESSCYEYIRSLDEEKIVDLLLNHQYFAKELQNIKASSGKLAQLYLAYYLLVMGRIRDLSISTSESNTD